MYVKMASMEQTVQFVLMVVKCALLTLDVWNARQDTARRMALSNASHVLPSVRVVPLRDLAAAMKTCVQMVSIGMLDLMIISSASHVLHTASAVIMAIHVVIIVARKAS